VGINHGRLQVLVAQQFLYCANVIAAFQQVRSERMAKDMTGSAFPDSCRVCCRLDGFLWATCV
jgi:hypothetical protein